MIGGWSGKNLTLVRRWEKFRNCWTRFRMPQVLLLGSGQIPSATRSSLVTWRMKSSLAQAPLWPCSSRRTHVGSWRRTAPSWVSAVVKAVNFFFLHWLHGTVCRGFLPGAPFPSPKILPSQVAGFHPSFSGVVKLDCGPCSYAGEAGLPQCGVCSPSCSTWLVSRRPPKSLLRGLEKNCFFGLQMVSSTSAAAVICGTVRARDGLR